jgi:hypothetical protein
MIQELRGSNQVIVGLTDPEDKADRVLRSVEQVSQVKPYSVEGGVRYFRVQLINGAPPQVCPKIAKRIVEEGCTLVTLYPERRDLETVFSEINSSDAIQGGTHV